MSRLVKIKVLTESKKEAIIKGNPLIITVKEPAQRGLANKAVVRLLSAYYGSRVRIVTGGRSPHKTIELQ
jgi:uncharacterized protein (TIGR00251 family)